MSASGKCAECGTACEGEFCSAQCFDLWRYGPKTTPGYSLLEVEIGNIRRDGKGGARKLWAGPLESQPERKEPHA